MRLYAISEVPAVAAPQICGVVLDLNTETLMTAPRPLPGRAIAFRGGSGFRVYVIHAAAYDEACQLDAEPIHILANREAWLTVVERAITLQGFSLAEYREAAQTERLAIRMAEQAVAPDHRLLDLEAIR